MTAVGNAKGRSSAGWPRGRLAGAVIVPIALLAVVDGAALAFAGRLPDPVATHFGSNGDANGSMPLIALLLLQSTFWLFMQVYTLVLRRGSYGITGARRPLGPRGRYTSAYAAFGVLAGVVAATIGANLDKPTWEDAHAPPGVLLAIASAGAIGAVVGALLARSDADGRRAPQWPAERTNHESDP